MICVLLLVVPVNSGCMLYIDEGVGYIYITTLYIDVITL